MKQIVKQVLHHTGAYRPAAALWAWVEPRQRYAVRSITRRNDRLITAYLTDHAQPKLHIGCADNHLQGWLNTDLNPRSNELYLDASQKFPFADASFDFIYSEHVIEHLSLPQGRVMIGQCFRTLRPNGVLRIVTPDLLALTALLAEPLTGLQRSYLEYGIKQYGLPGSPPRAAHLLNHFVRTWGHTFIYDRPTLIDEFHAAGFGNVVACRLNDSAHPVLRNLANAHRMPPGLLELESLTIEGQKVTGSR